MKTEMLKKHHFWILFGAVPLLVGLLVILMLAGPNEAIAKQSGEYKKRSDEVAAAKAMGTGMLAELAKQKETLEERRGQLWGVNYERQKNEGVFAWPSASRDKYLKDLEKLDLRFGAKEVPSLDTTKDADTQYVVINDEMAKFTNSANYIESYNRMATSVQPTRFGGTGWQSILRHVTNWISDSSPGGRPGSHLFWLALEDFWIQRALLKPIADVNALAAKFDLVKPATGPDTPLKRTFQNRTWEIDIELVTDGPNRVLKSKLKNKTDRLQMLGLNKTMRLKVWFEDPKVSRNQPFEYRMGGELVKGSGQISPKVVAEIHKIPAGMDPTEIFKIEQILDEITVPIRLIRRVELGYRDSKRNAIELKLPSFIPEEVAAAEPAAGGPPEGMPAFGGGERGPGGMMGMGAAGAAGAAGARVGTAAQVLSGNKKRYIERTEQVRRVPVGLDLVVDQAYVNDVLIALGNSPLRVQITQTQWQRFRDPLAVGGSPSGAPPSEEPEGGTPPDFGGGGEDSESGRRGSSGLGQPRPPGSGTGAMFPGGSGLGGSAPGGSTGSLPQSQVTAGLVELAVYGIVSIYEKAKVKPVDPNKPIEPKAEEPAPVSPAPKPEEPKQPPIPPTAPPK